MSKDEIGMTVVGRLYGDKVIEGSFGREFQNPNEDPEPTPSGDYLYYLARDGVGEAIVVTQPNFEHWKLLQELAEEQHITIIPSDWYGKPNLETGERALFSYSSMCNAGIGHALNRGNELCLFVSTDLSDRLRIYTGVLKHLTRLDDRCLYIGVATSGIHDLDLIGKVLEGQVDLTSDNSHLVLPNNAFGAYGVGAIRRGLLNQEDVWFPDYVDDGHLGRLQLGNKAVKIGGNEEVATIMRLADKGMNFYMILELPIIREGLGTYIGNEDKMVRRVAVIDYYREHVLQISDAVWDNYLNRHFYYLLGNFPPDENGTPRWDGTVKPFLRKEQKHLVDQEGYEILPDWMRKEGVEILTPGEVNSPSFGI